ncbi:MAG TPA: Crp/Fnr family transcriptional regulator [Negativicutes bacterium]|nr:Crp/Fnr family transcriptional regulator [Negativicutes bacterium]
MKTPDSLLVLSAEDIVEFKVLAKPLQIKVGAILFAEGDYSDYIYYIEAGHVKLYRSANSGKVSLISIRKAGDVFGIASVLTGSSCYVSAETVDACKMWRMTGNVFREMLYARPKLAVQIASVMSKRMQDLEKAIVNLTCAGVDHRLAAVLLDLAKSSPGAEKQGTRIDMMLTHQDIASMIGSCRQTVTTTLGKFKDDGIIKTGKRYIEITNLKKMEQYMG